MNACPARLRARANTRPQGAEIDVSGQVFDGVGRMRVEARKLRSETEEDREFAKREAAVQAAFDVGAWIADLDARGIRVRQQGGVAYVPSELMQPRDWHNAERFKSRIIAWLQQ